MDTRLTASTRTSCQKRERTGPPSRNVPTEPWIRRIAIDRERSRRRLQRSCGLSV
jgi:hypothetical protein